LIIPSGIYLKILQVSDLGQGLVYPDLGPTIGTLQRRQGVKSGIFNQFKNREGKGLMLFDPFLSVPGLDHRTTIALPTASRGRTVIARGAITTRTARTAIGTGSGGIGAAAITTSGSGLGQIGAGQVGTAVTSARTPTASVLVYTIGGTAQIGASGGRALTVPLT